MAPASPDDSKSAQVTKLSNQISRHFKKCGLRKVEFKKQKSLLIEKELQAHFIRAKHEKEEDVASRPVTSPLPSPTRSASTPLLRASEAVAGTPSLQSLGKAATRFAASHPEFMHPVIHPGACGRPSSPLRLKSRNPTERHAEPERRARDEQRPDEVSYVTHSAPASPPGHGEHETAGDVQFLSTSLNATKFRRASPKKRTMPAFGFFPGAVEREETEEDRLFGAPSREEELLAAADAEAAALRATWAGGLRPRDPPDMIERLGDLMALLGPRYRTLPRAAIWEKAVVGSTTALQRREKRLGPAAAHSISGFARSRGQSQGSKNRARSPEWLPDYDPDGPARAAWLQARERENEMKAKASSRLKVSFVSSLGTSLSLRA